MSKGSNMDLLEHYVKIGSLQDVQCIINRGDMKFDEEYLDYGLLKTSLLCEHREIAKLLVKNNFRVNKSSLLEPDQTPLHLAVKGGWKDLVELLLQKEASVTVRSSDNLLTPIQLSFLEKSYEITDMMLLHDEGKAIFDSKEDISHLHIAAARNGGTAINKYLRFGADINLCLADHHPDWSRYTPLHIAVELQNRESVELLLKWGADITAQDKRGNTPLHLAAMLPNDSLIDLILSKHKYNCKNPKNEDGLSHFHIACTRNDVKNIHGFLQCGVDIQAKVSDSAQNYAGFTALHFATINQCTDVIEILLCSVFRYVDTKDFLSYSYKTGKREIISSSSFITDVRPVTLLCNKNISLLHMACMQRKSSEIGRLINAGASVNDRLPEDAPRWPGATALHILLQVSQVIYNFFFEIELLVENGADIAAVDAQGKTPLHIAFEKMRCAAKLMLAQYSKIDVDFIADKDGLSHFHIACTGPHTDLVVKFLDAGADINSIISNDSLRFPGYTPLHMAVAFRKRTTTIELLKRGADITIKNGLGLTAFDLLLQTWNMNGRDSYKMCYKCIESFLMAADKINSDAFDTHGFTLLQTSCVTENTDLFKSCIDRLKVNAAVDFNSRLYPAGYTALHFAVQYGTDEMVKTLLDYGADPSIRTPAGCTPLHLWVCSFPKYLNVFNMKKRLNTVDVRLALDENPFNSEGLSQFHVVCKLLELDVVRFFLDRAGVDINVKTKILKDKFLIKNPRDAGATGLHMAVYRNDEKLTRLLLERGADVNARDAFLKTPLDKKLDSNVCNCFGDKSTHYWYLKFWQIDELKVLVALLEYGADIRIPAKDWTIDPRYFDKCCLYRRNLIRRLFMHIVAMTTAGCKVSYIERLQTWYVEMMQSDYAKYWLPPNGPDSRYYNSETEYQTACRDELEGMDTILRDALQQDVHELIANDNFFRSVDVDTKGVFAEKFCGIYIYGYLIEARYRRGMKRKEELVEKSIWALIELSSFRLCIHCAEAVLQYLTIVERSRLIEAANL